MATTTVWMDRQARGNWRAWGLLAVSLVAVMGLMAWQSSFSGGNPNPLADSASRTSSILDIAVLVFREGLECVLVLAALTASMSGAQAEQRKPVAVGVGFGLVATLITWMIAVQILNSLADNVSALNLQAATGMLAIVVLLVIMNWFFHKMYWTGWISLHNKKKRELTEGGGVSPSAARVLFGLAMLGFSSMYREGFEIVLFLQTYRLKLGGQVVLLGVLVGAAAISAVAVLTFFAQRKLPYRKMLVVTGVMLGMVLFVMVGEQMQEMQLAHWIPTHTIAMLKPYTKPWMGLWFAIFPTVETLMGQLLAVGVVLGSYFAASRRGPRKVESTRGQVATRA